MFCLKPLASRSIVRTTSTLKITTQFSHSPASLFRCAFESRPNRTLENDENDDRANHAADVADQIVQKQFCMRCGTGFCSGPELEAHVRDKHRRESSDVGKRSGFACPTCSKIFQRSGDLKKHNRFHTGERPFRCSICGKNFHQSGHLKNHVRIHTNERPFACSICCRGFRQSCNLKRHMKTHESAADTLIVKTIFEQLRRS